MLNFTLAVNPNTENLDEEIKFLNLAAFYADKISVLSPNIDTYDFLNRKSKNKKNIEMELINKLLKSLPICEFVSKDDLSEERDQLLQLESVVKSGGYKNSSLIERMKIQSILKESEKATIEDLRELYGEDNIDIIEALQKEKILYIEHFKSSIENVLEYSKEFFEKLDKLYKKEIPLLDNKTTENFENNRKNIIELPDFSDKSFNEILDLRKDLKDELDNFRKSLSKLNKEIENYERKEEDYNIDDLVGDILEDNYNILIKKLEEKGIENNKKLSLNIASKGEIFNGLYNLVPNIISSSASFNEDLKNIEKYNLKDEKNSILYFEYK